ncbi:hypothetical protein PPACK8108_LOCUS8333 [Phakopsora pachyrhizi]|uniref:Uncharacterized protein n=1 Tax=Phakopsora pachyrhizi TaxID=170000 RepID=A0AAV0AWY5_PHAPC|nr:hypothetical protein PPACK8108_LOCUS8333 [Phakopsora pachyrhizi]
MGVQSQKRVPLASGGEEIRSHVIPEGAVASSTTHVRSSENARGNNNHSLSYKSIISHRTLSSSITVGQSSAANCPTSLNLAAKSMSISLDAMANHTQFDESSSGNTTNDASKPMVKPLEFNHAITYVNKIKNCYAGDPKTHKTFLDILQTYQRDARPIQEGAEETGEAGDGVTTQMVSSHSHQSLADSKTEAQSSAYKISGEIKVSSVQDELPGLQETSPSVSQSKNQSFQTGAKAVIVDVSNQGEKNHEAKNGLIKLSAPQIQVQSEESPKKFAHITCDKPEWPGQISKDNNFERQNGKQVNSYIKLLSVVQSFNSGSIDQKNEKESQPTATNNRSTTATTTTTFLILILHKNNNQSNPSSTPAVATSNSASILTSSTSAVQTPTAAQPLLNNNKQPILSQQQPSLINQHNQQQSRLIELLDCVKHEFDNLNSEAPHLKSQSSKVESHGE